MSAPPPDPDYFEALQRWSEVSARLREEISRLSAHPNASLVKLHELHRELQTAQQLLQSLARPADKSNSGNSLQ